MHQPLTRVLFYPIEPINLFAESNVPFEHYETPKTDAKGIHRTPEVRPVAWFRDPAGNILSPLVFGTTPSTLTSLPSSSSDFLPLGGYEQRKFQLGFKFAF